MRARGPSQTPIRVPLVQGRLGGTLLVLLAVLCTATSTVWPTHTLTLTPTAVEAAGGAQAQQIAFWSWGRVADAGPATTDPSLDFGNPWGLVLLVMAIGVAVVAAVCHALRAGSDGLLLGVAGTAWLAGHVVADLGQTAGRMDGYFYGFDQSLTADTTAVGVLQLIAVALLVVALGTMARRPLVSLAAVVQQRVSALVQAVRDRRAPAATRAADPAEETPPALPRVGIATIRDVEPRTRPGWADGTRSGVGFSDDSGPQRSTDRTSATERFRPPR